MTCCQTPAIQQPSPWVKRVISLAWFTVVYNVVEGLVSMGFGAAEESVALFGFGADSMIEVASAVLVLWRFRGEVGEAEALPVERERKATLGIGALFLGLALATAAGAILQLASATHPATTLPGLIIAAASLSFMVWLWKAKTRAAVALNSKTVAMDAQCSLACIRLSAILAAGSLLFLALPALWWVDAAAALALSALIGREGWETIQHARQPDFAGGCGCAGETCH